MTEVYLKRKRYVKRIKDLYKQIDSNESNSVSVNEFFELIDILEKDSQFHIPLFPDLYIWDVVRKFFT